MPEYYSFIFYEQANAQTSYKLTEWMERIVKIMNMHEQTKNRKNKINVVSLLIACNHFDSIHFSSIAFPFFFLFFLRVNVCVR